MQKFPPIILGFDRFPYGGDCNPDQWWHDMPDIVDEDMKFARTVKCNTFSVGIFSRAEWEPEAGSSTFPGSTPTWTEWRRKVSACCSPPPAARTRNGWRKNLPRSSAWTKTVPGRVRPARMQLLAVADLPRKSHDHQLLTRRTLQPEPQAFSLYDLSGGEMVTGETVRGSLTMPGFGSLVIRLD